MDEETLKNYLEAARVASSVSEVAKSVVVPGKKMLAAAEEIEKEIFDEGAKPAFPVNISLNECAAHYTPKARDEKVFGEKNLVKIDFGVHYNGFISDNAFTIDLSGEHSALVEASEKALENALTKMRAGVSAREIGKEIQETIVARGFKPIENLGGHSLDKFVLHAGEEIPNTAKGDYVFQEGDVFAVEPFATTGAGRVIDSNECEIYSLINFRNVRLPQSRQLLEFISKEFELLPFAERWLAKKFSEATTELALRDLVRQNVLHEYHVLKEVNSGLVSQAEATVMIEKDGVRVLG